MSEGGRGRRFDETETGFLDVDEGLDPRPADASWVGRVVAGRFEVTGFVASGGMGSVFRARQVGLEREVALKVLHAHLASDDVLRRRFHREARAASMLRHPAAVTIFDYGEWEGRLYLAMEFLDGCSLADLLQTSFPFPPERIVQWLVPTCEVLAEAHGAGVLHRDLKPSNVMVVDGPDGRETTRLVDFGLARAEKLEDDGLRLTPARLVVGTPEYMSPEQCRGRPLDGRSDLYSLGALVYELLCGQPPFSGDGVMDVMVQHLYHEPRRPSEVRPDVPMLAALEALALRALAKRPEDRPGSALEFRRALLDALDPDAAPTLDDRARRFAEARDRRARADAFGLPWAEPRTSVLPEEIPRLHVAVVEPAGGPVDSLVTRVRALGYTATRATGLDRLHDGDGAPPDVVLLDLRPDPDGWLEAARAWLTTEPPPPLPLVAVGPAAPLDLLTRALEIGVRDYVPEPALTRLLPRTLEGLVRQRLRHLQPPPAEGPP